MPPPNAPTRSLTGAAADIAGVAALGAYRGLVRLAAPALPLLLRRRTARGKADPARADERFGLPSQPRPAGRLAWVHAASVGETLALAPLVRRIVGDGIAVVFTSGTVTSAAIAAEVLPAGALHQYAPFDVPSYVSRFLDHWRPQVAIVAESELWPTTIAILARRSIPLAIVNGRLSDRSFPRWRRFAFAAAPLFRRLTLVLAQSEQDAARFTALGAPRVFTTGNLKWDAPVLPGDPAELARLRAAIGKRPVWLAASTHAGEEAIVAAAHVGIAAQLPRLLTLLVPRHPQRGDAIAAELAAAGRTTARRSRGEAVTAATEIYLADTLGELGLFYRLAPLAFVGNSLVSPGGGHNPQEAVALQAVVLHGPHVDNFGEVFARIDGATRGARVSDGQALIQTVAALLADRTKGEAMGRAQSAALTGLGGALEATLAALRPYFGGDARAA